MKRQSTANGRRLLSLLLVLLMICGLFPMGALAAGEPQNPTVTLKAAPASVSVSLYTDADCTSPVAASGVTDDGTVGKYRQYTLALAPGAYYYKGADGETDLGVGYVYITDADTQSFIMVRHNFYTTNGAFAAAGDWTILDFADKTENQPYAPGATYLEGSRPQVSALLIGDHSYGGSLAIKPSFEDGYYLGTWNAFTASKTATAAQNKTLPINAYKVLSVTVPADAAVQIYKQESNYVVTNRTEEITSTLTNGDGTKTYIIKGTSAHSNYQYRATKAGQVTLAGYLEDNKPVAAAFPTDKTPLAAASDLAQDDNSILLNIDDGKDTNELAMQVGETFKVRAWRAAWEIVNTTTANQMIEPDMHYAILSGDDVISIEPTDVSEKGSGYCSGNADGNWMNVIARKEGIAVVAVWYDAISVTGATPGSFFGASDPARYGVFVVNVGADTTVNWRPASSDGDWDSEFDTVYYVGDSGVFTIRPEGATAVSVQNVYGNALGTAQSVAAEADGSYAVPVKSGANIIRATTADGDDYLVVRAKAIHYSITNNTTGESGNDAAPAISTGDSVTIALNGLDMPVPKMSGIYNPGYMGTAKLAYTLNDSYVLLSAGTQYDFVSSGNGNSITFTALVPGENRLEGFISLSCMGDDFGNHRNTTDLGRTMNGNAAEKFGQFGSLPAICFEVADTGVKPTYEEATALDSLLILGGLNSYTNAFSMGNVNAMTGKVTGAVKPNDAATWTKATGAMSSYTLQVKASAKSYVSRLQLKYWFEGEAAATVDLTSGVTAVIPNPGFDNTKILNMELLVTPADPTVGGTKTYSYLVYPGGSNGSANLSFVHPVIAALSFTDGESAPLALTPGLSYTETAYSLDAGGSSTLNISATMLQKYVNAEKNTQDKADAVTVQKLAGGQPVGDAVTAAPADENAYPVGSWTLDDLDISDADALEITVTSYVNAASRTYTVSLVQPQHQHTDANFDGVCDDCTAELGTVKTAAVDYASQMSGAYLHAPKSGVSVASNLAELYGFADGVSYLEDVSVLDVLVQAHIDVFGTDFTKTSAASYLAVGAYGSPDMQFAVPGTEAYGGFLLNHAIPNDGTASPYGGYNGTAVATQAVKNGDLAEFFFYEDDAYGDTCNWFEDANGYSRSFGATAGRPLELTLKGFFAMYGYQCRDAAEMAASDDAFAVEDAQIYTVDLSTGALTAIEGAVTDEDGKVSLTFAEPGTYAIAAYGTEDCTFLQLLSMTTVSVAAAPAGAGSVRVVVENTTFPKSAGALWEGTLVDEWVAIDEASTMMSAVAAALANHGYSQEGAESNYISAVNGLAAGDGGVMSGWMGTLNDWFTSEGFEAFTAAAGTLEDGDEIRIVYTCDFGSDVGGDWNSTDKTLSALTASVGTLSPAFDKDIRDYTLTVPAGTASVLVAPTAANRNYQVHTTVGGTEYKRSAAIPAANGTVVTVTCGDPSWPSMSANSGEAQVYTVTVQTAGSADTALVTLTVSNKGVLARDKDGEAMADRAVTVTDRDADGALTVHDALLAAHEAYLSADGYAASASAYGLSVTKLWGVETMNTLFFVNGSGLLADVGTDTVAEGDVLVASVNADDTYYADWYTAFDKASASVAAGEELTLTLTGGQGMGYPADFTHPAKGVAVGVWKNGAFEQLGGAVTGENGSCTLTFAAAGTYVVTAAGTVTDTVTDWSNMSTVDTDCPIIAPVCVVTVSGGSDEPYLSGLTLSLAPGGENILAFDPEVTDYRFDVPQSTEYVYVTATLADTAPAGSKLIARYPIFGDFMTFSNLTSGTEGSVWFFDPIGANETTVTVNAGPDEEQSYTIVLTPVKEGFLETLEIRTSETGENLLAGFDSEIDSYQVEVPTAADTLYLTAALADRAPAGSRMMLGDAEVKTDGSTTVYALGAALGTDARTLNFTVGAQTYAVTLKPVPEADDPDEAFAGSGTEDDPYLISNADELSELKLFVNSGKADFADKFVKLTADITLPEGWNPIGCTKDGTVQLQSGRNLSVFSGTFDGDGHTITVPKGGLPLFGYVKNTTIQNLNIYGEQIEGHGLVNNYEGVGLYGMAVTIDNVTLLSGTKTLRSGLLGGNITVNSNAANSIGFNAAVTNCTVEEGCVIGYTGAESSIGSIAGRMQGTIKNCVSYADVRGENYVGGIMGTRDNSLDPVTVEGCTFGGSVEGKAYVGGIVGSGYNPNATAPNAHRIGISGNRVTGSVTGVDAVGGILGGDPYVAQVWNEYAIRGNTFTGTVSGETNVGAIIGYYRSLNGLDDIADNLYAADCGAEKGIGGVEFVDTAAEAPTAVDGVTYFNTGNGTEECPAVSGCGWRANHQRTDDPLGADAEKLCRAIEENFIQITVTVSSRGVLAQDRNGEAMVNRTVTVKDLDDDGVFTVHEALLAAHEVYLASDGYAAAETAYGLSVGKLWGVETMNTLFFVNGSPIAMGVGADAVAEGDALLASVNADDTYYADWYTAFDKASASVAAGEELTLTLTGGQGMGYPADFTRPAAGVKIGVWKNGGFEQHGSSVTGENGKCTLTFAEAGTYIVTASGTVADSVTDWATMETIEADCPIIAPVCIVTVTAGSGGGSGSSGGGSSDEDRSIAVSFTLLGDDLHGESADEPHMLKNGTLKTWIPRRTVKLDEGATVKDALETALREAGGICVNPTGNYVVSITFGGVTLGEMDNGPLSGWMYTLNGSHPDLGVAEQRLHDGDAIVFHYTDDYTAEQGSEQWREEGGGSSKSGDSADETEETADEAALPAYEKVSLPAESGQILVIVNVDGSETVVKKSVMVGGTLMALVPAGAEVRLADAQAVSFEDVAADAWYAGAVAFASSRRLFNGVSDTAFAPDAPMTRAMLATVLYRLEDASASGANPFADVADGTWYADAVIWASEAGIVTGTDRGFEPDANVTREQIAVMLYRYVKQLGIDVSGRGDLNAFADVGDTADWAREAMEWAVSAGLFRGDESGSLNPKGEATRAEVATLLERLIELLVKS